METTMEDTRTRVADCGHEYARPEGGTGGAAGYARLADTQYVPALRRTLPTDSTVCYPCADSIQRRELIDGRNQIGGYLSGDGHTITTWTGGDLMRVTWLSGPDRRVTPTGGQYERWYIDARDIWGQLWRGIGSGHNMFVRMRRIGGRPGVPMGYQVDPIPIADAVRMIERGHRGIAQCGECGRYWNDDVATGVTPTPGGRCPFEYFH